VGLDLVMLLVHQAAQLALHRLEGVVDHFFERRVRAVVRLPRWSENRFIAGRPNPRLDI
jgi:hypothetical protein